MAFCPQCGTQVDDQATFCPNCGAAQRPVGSGTELPPQPDPMTGQAAPPVYGAEYKSKIVAALLGIFLGGLGIHRFYLGYTGIGVVQLVLGLAGVVTCGATSIVSALWGLIEGILILTGSINRDAQGRALRE